MSRRVKPLLRYFPWTQSAQRLRALAAAAAVPFVAALSLAACGTGTSVDWWHVGSSHAAEAATPPDSGETPAGSYLAGQAAVNAGDLRTAATSYQAALAAEPDNLELRRQVFALLLASGEFERALPAARELVQADPGADDAVLFLALDHARSGENAEAARLLEKLGKDGLIGTVRPIVLAWARFGAGEHAPALAALTDADPRAGLDRLRDYHRAVMLGLDGRPREGLELLRAAFPDQASAPVRVIRAAVDLQLAAGDRAGADSLVAAARKAEPDDRQLEWLAAGLASGRTRLGAVQGPTTGMSDALTGISEALSDQDGGGQALPYARLAQFVTPEDGEVSLLIARIALDQDHPDEALRALDGVTADSPVAWSAQLARARALQDLKRPEEAVKLLTAMADEAPDRADALIALGDLLRGEDRFAEAETAYTRAVERLPAIDRQHWRLLYARGITYERTQRWPQAEADLLKALELEPDQPFILNYLGYSWVDKGLNLDRAKAMLHRAVELKPDDGYIVDSLGWAYFRLGDNGKAVTYLERAVELEPADPVVNDHLGDAYWHAGRFREARFQWQRSLVFNPEADLLAQIQGKLANGLPDAGRKPG